ncbi:hypothetical protein [Pseudonocardia xishanensis]|uniref:Uncharacterized protein n=1 Tax=Pseudonocardia xishanensis TaxID=630995 RepID=A0ABP8RNI9_9PSEU
MNSMDPRNDHRLAAAFRDAVPEPPEAGFSADDVRRESHRIGRRNRMLLTGGVAAAVIVLAGGVTTGVVLARDGRTTTSAAAPAQDSGSGARELGAPDLAREAAPGGSGAAVAPAPVGVPLGPASGRDCVNPQDPELRALVDTALPALASARQAPTTMVCRQGGGREVNLEVVDGDLTGLLSVVYTPPGEEPTQTAGAVGWVMEERSTASGGLVTVTSRAQSDSGGVPFAAEVATLADALAPRL